MTADLCKVGSTASWPLYDVATTRRIEQAAINQLPSHSLMQRAGLATARLALALAPHARRIWIAAGPGNNGGDGIEAARHLHGWGKHVVVTWLGDPASAPTDALAARQRALDAGLVFAAEPDGQFDLCLDALLGIGASRAPDGRMAQWIGHMRATSAPVLAIDVPTGLNADTGVAAQVCVRARATLCLLTLKPGLFTGAGRDATEQVWFDPLGVDLHSDALAHVAMPGALLAGAPAAKSRLHASHKGSYGDVGIVGGASGMAGAALLAGSAALHCGAGRVFVALLDRAAMTVDAIQPELMLRDIDQLDLGAMTVVCGCGGGDAVRAYLPRIVAGCKRLVLDADALNAVAADSQVQALLRARAARGRHTVLTPHPLEAARLLGSASNDIQQDRLVAALRLATLFQCTVVLKGSGTVVASPSRLPVINPTGNALLASAGTGDVLAGVIGALLAHGLPDFQAASEAVFLHGQSADRWPADSALSASRLARSMRAIGQ